MNLYIATIITVVAFLLVRQILEYLWMRPKRLEWLLRAQGLTGNPYRLRHGDLMDINATLAAAHSTSLDLDGGDVAAYVLPFHHHLLAKYGKRSFMWIGPKPRIMIMEVDMIKEALQNYEGFQKVFSNPLNKLLLTGILQYEGDKWAKHRRIVNAAFTIAKLKDMVPTMVVCCSHLVDKMEAMLFDKVAHEIDVWPLLSNFTADVISRTAFGSNYVEGHKIFPLLREQAKLVLQLTRSAYIPGFRFLPTKANKRMKEITKEMWGIITEIIQTRETKEKNSNDLLGILLENKNKEDEGITIEEVLAECKAFYMAGQGTTSTLLVWALVMLSIHRDWQMQAREEVIQVFGMRKPDFDALHQLKKMNMIINEVLRLYPPAPTLLRSIPESVKLGDITLPGGVEIVTPTILVHHDKEIWGNDAKEFKPERFAEGVAKASKGQLGAFFPFALGPRFCVGQNFALVEAKLALAMILQHFGFEVSPSYEHAPVQVITMQPKFGAKIMFSKL